MIWAEAGFQDDRLRRDDGVRCYLHHCLVLGDRLMGQNEESESGDAPVTEHTEAVKAAAEQYDIKGALAEAMRVILPLVRLGTLGLLCDDILVTLEGKTPREELDVEGTGPYGF